MAKNINFISHKKSTAKVEGKPKLPSSGALEKGELAINYAKGIETIAIENESGDVVSFSSDNYYTELKLGSGFTGENSANTVTDLIKENEEIVSAALVDLDDRKAEKTDIPSLTNYASKSWVYGRKYINKTTFEDKLGSAFTGANSAVTVTEALDNVDIEVDQVLDNTTSGSSHAVATKAVYSAVTDNELVWTNAYVALSGAVSSHTLDTSIHRKDLLSKVDISTNVSVSCPGDMTGATNDGAEATVIYANTSSSTDYTVTVNATYITPNGSQMILTCPKSGFCKVTYMNINGTIYVTSN